MATAQQLITRAFQKLGVFEASETPPAADLETALTGLNELLDEWNADAHGPAQRYTTLSTELVLPPGYESALVANLAVWMAPVWGATPSPELTRIAQRTLATIRRRAVQTPERQCDPGVGGMPIRAFNLYTGS